MPHVGTTHVKQTLYKKTLNMYWKIEDLGNKVSIAYLVVTYHTPTFEWCGV